MDLSSDRGGPYSLVVCTYSREREDLLDGLIRSVVAGTVQPDEWVVVVDREPALHADLDSRLGAKGIKVLASPAGGLSAARNIGWRASFGKWVIFVDDDATVAEDWLERIIAEAESSRGAILGGRVEPDWGPAGAPGWYTSRLGWIVGCTFDGFPESSAEVRSVIGCNMAIKRELLERLDGFAGGLGREGTALIGSEETEFCMRAGLAGEQVWYQPAARVWQVVPLERRGFRYARRRAIGEGRSKARLATLHGPVLAMEGRYTQELIREGIRRTLTGVIRRPPGTMTQGLALFWVLGTTAVAYASERLRLIIAQKLRPR